MGRKLTPQEKFDKSKIKTQKMKDDFKELVAGIEWNEIISPIYLPKEKKTKPDTVTSINLNTYRNINFIVNNNLKKQYKEWMKDQLEWRTWTTPIWVTYTLYYSHKSDLMNVASIVSKYFLDAMVEYKCIPDDNIDIVIEEHSVVWWKTKQPHMKITIL